MASPFRLTHAFSITSLIGIGILSVVLGLLYQMMAEATLIEHESRANADLSQALSNALLERYRDYIADAGGQAQEALQNDPRAVRLQEDVAQLMRGLRVRKIHIYDRNGVAIFSTDKLELGRVHKGSPGFQTAMGRQVFSRLVGIDHHPGTEPREYRHDDHHEGWAIWRWLEFGGDERTFMASYIPIQDSPMHPVQGVFEIYSDISSLVARKDQSGMRILAVIVGLMCLLYLSLLLFVRRADRIIRAHDALTRGQQEERIRYLAHHDELTGLPNRALFMDLLRQGIQQRRKGLKIAIFAVGVDRFRLVNDSLGHEAGDRLLAEVAQRITQSMSGRHKGFRVGGDEFVVMDEFICNPEEAGVLAERILRAINQPLQLEGQELFVSASIGIAFCPDDSDNPEALLNRAFSAMENAKRFGGGCHVFYTEDLNEQNRERLELELALRRAQELGQFELFYQPKVESAGKRVTGVEALLRWRHPGKGLVGPDRFIPLLEATGMIVPVGAWVIHEGCRQAMEWQRGGMTGLQVAVNVSLKQLQSPASLLETVHEALAASGLAPECLELELTESVLAEDVERVVETLCRLKKIGVRLSIDDFGTGYSSLSYLSHMPIDALKIDMLFTRNIEQNEEHASITRAIISLAQSLRLAVTAEGIESRGQLDFINALGCGTIQGYYFSPPVEAARLPGIVKGIEQGTPPPGA